jgi:serine/threonine-protein phosphatase PP1 catalytic subunit
MLLLLCFKIKYPENFFLLRGNHETEKISKYYGFMDSCKRFYRMSLWHKFVLLFRHFPVAALIEYKILCMHGGLSESLKDVNDIQDVLRPNEIPDNGMLCDLLWADPSKEH